MRQNNEAIGSLAIRLARIAGQVRGVRRMIDEGRPCLEIAGQISAAVGALRQVRLKLLAAHLQSCLSVASHGSPESCKRGWTRCS
jgi:DNA-binding FrmR family transcriptional regulator